MFEGAIALGLVPVMLGLGGDSAGVVWAVMIALGVAILRRRSERPCVPRAIARGGFARTTGPR